MKLTRCFHIYWNFLNSRFFLSFRVENVGLIIPNCKLITGVLWLERSSYKECSAIRQKVSICYLDLKKASEMLCHFSFLVNMYAIVRNREQLRNSNRALCLKGNCYFKSGLKILLKLKNVPLTTALEVWGHGESTGLVYFTLYWVLGWDIWREITRHLNILERLWYRADDAQLSFSQWVYSLRFCLQQEYASCSCIQQVVQNECD